MENNDFLESTIAGGDTLDNNVKNQLFAAAKWAKFLAIVNLVFLVLVIGILVVALPAMYTSMGGAIFGIIFFYVVFLGLGVYLLVKLFQFGKNGQIATKSDDQELYLKAFSGLNTFFRISGIIMIVILVMYGATFLFMGSALISSFTN